MEFEVEQSTLTTSPGLCIVCCREVNETEDTFNEIPKSERLNVLSNVLRLSSQTIYQGLNITELLQEQLLYCSSCAETILNSLSILQEIKALEKNLTVLTNKLKQDLIQSYNERKLAEEESVGENDSTSGDLTINLIRKTLVQCWTNCHVELERGVASQMDPISMDCSSNTGVAAAAEQEFESDNSLFDDDDGDDDDYKYETNRPTKRSSKIKGKARIKNNKPTNRLVGLRSLVTSKQQRGRTNLPFTCSLCGKGYQIESSLELHKKCHEGDLNFSCSICESKFVSKRSLHLHESRRHQKKPEEKPYGKLPCPICSKEFQTDQNLNAHVASIHENSFKFTCGICNAGFNIRSALANHEQYVHTTEKNFECQICHKRFKRSHQLFYHKRVHTGERLICEICGRGFMQPEKLKWHLEAHAGAKKYPCPYCGKLFAVKNYVSSHIYATHEGRRKPRTKSSTTVKPVETENIITFNIVESGKAETEIVVVTENVHII